MGGFRDQEQQQVRNPQGGNNSNGDDDMMISSPTNSPVRFNNFATAPVYPGPLRLIPNTMIPARPPAVLPGSSFFPTSQVRYLANLPPTVPIDVISIVPPPQPVFLPPQPPPVVVKPVLTVRQLQNVAPCYNGVNPNYPGLKLVNVAPPIYCVENFLTDYECDFLMSAAEDGYTPAPVVGKGNGEVSQSRTSSTCYLAREDLPSYMNKVSFLTGKPVEHCELPQVGRYLPSQQYLQHFDAFDLSNEDGVRFASNGGQRTVTVLTYLNYVPSGGHTSFPTLNLKIQPKRGMAVVFFPATVDGLLDEMALHAAEPAVDVKYVSQVWIRQSMYSGQASKRLLNVL